MKQTLLSDWNFLRVLRLALGIFIAIQALETRDALSGVIAAFLLFQAVSNTGCCGVNSCSTPIVKNKSGVPEEIEFEEIKLK